MSEKNDRNANELTLLSRIAGGDNAAAELFDAQYRPLLLRFLQGRVPRDQQDDIVQETLMAAFQAISAGAFCGKSALGTWLTGILKHKIADYRATQQQEFVVWSPIGDSELDIKQPTTTSARLNPSATINIEVEQRLKALPKLHRVILLLKLREDLTTEEIAAGMKLPKGTVGRILWEAKRMLVRQRGMERVLSRSER